MFNSGDDNLMLITDGTLRKLEQLITLRRSRGDLCQGPVETVSGLISEALRKELIKEVK